MEYKKIIEDNILVLELEGDLIGENNGPDLMEIVGIAIASGINQCALNIEGIRYINSSGIGVLITIMTSFKNKEGSVILVNPSEKVKKLLAITKLDTIFAIANDKEEAILELKK